MKTPPLIVTSLLGVSLASLSFAEDTPCTAQSDSLYFDLRPLQAKKDYEFQASTSDRKFYLNLCRNVVTELWNADRQESTIGAFYRGDHGDISIGSVNTTVKVVNGEAVMYLEDGSSCPRTSSMSAATAVRFVCDRGVSNEGSPQLVAQLPSDESSACAFFVEWRTHVACPTTVGTGAGRLIVIFTSIVFVAFLAYIFAGTLYNRYVLGYRGWDQIPRISIFTLSDAIVFFQNCYDTILETFGHSQRGWGSYANAEVRFDRGHSGIPRSWSSRPWGGAPGARSGFRSVPTHPSEESQPIIDARFSLDADEDQIEGPPSPKVPIPPPKAPISPVSPTAPTANGGGRQAPPGSGFINQEGVIRL